MVLAGAWLLRTRERRLMSEAVSETRAYATALAIALEHAGERTADLDRIIARVSAEPSIYGLLLYNADGQVVAAAAPVDPRSGMAALHVQALIRAATPTTTQRSINGRGFLSVLRPLRREGGGISGALEVVQPLSTVEAELARTRQRFIESGLLIVAVVVLITLLTVRQTIARPLQNFLRATSALGRGELNYRIPATHSGSELEELRTEFNNMADRLQAASERVARETDTKFRLERQLRHTEKLAVVGNLAASLAHEIAAPLNVVGGRAEILQRGDQPVEQRRRNLEIISEQIARITLIVRNLLDYARSREVQLRPIALGNVVEGVLEFLETELTRANVTVNTDIPALYVEADPDLMHQIFLNLLLNSIQALDTIEGDRRITITAYADATFTTVEIMDNGPGMSEEVAAQALEPFFTTKPQRGGTGLGLAVARNIIEEHGGTIRAEPGTGGRLVMTLRTAAHDA
jgi:signal transduction histidine kinase